MTTESERGYCQHNLKPLLVLLVLLVAATIVWAVVLKQRGGFHRVRRGAGAPLANTDPQRPAAGPAAVPVPPATPASLSVDAVSLATPKGGVKLIAQTAAAPLPTDPMGSPGPSARVRRVAAAKPQSLNVFNTVSALILPAVVSVHATRSPSANPTIAAEGGVPFVNPFDGVPDKFVRN